MRVHCTVPFPAPLPSIHPRSSMVGQKTESGCSARTVGRPSLSIVQQRSHSRPRNFPELTASSKEPMLGVASSSTDTSQPGAISPKVSAGDPGKMYQKYKPSPGRACGGTGPPRSATARSVGLKASPLKTSKREVPSEQRQLGCTGTSTCWRERKTCQIPGVPTPAPVPGRCCSKRASTSCGRVTGRPQTRKTTSPSDKSPSHAPPVVTRDTINT
mmetsp:Transcript_49316/g.142910  ORF Transcript_49316/g.142910 Transcript_49316/m.142910 type:complete len:215 (-) Transcript_49316:2564-3208(-)